MRVLVTGFEPFGKDRLNPSEVIARNLPRMVGGAHVLTMVLPVVYGASLRMLLRRVALERPDAVLCMGLAGGRAKLSFETRAVNLNDARIPDNDGRRPRGEPIHEGGPAGLPPTLPLDDITTALRAAGLPVERSPSAGTFLCNHVFYGLVDHLHANDPSVMGGFVHVPWIREQQAAHPGSPTLALDTIMRGVCRAIAVLDS